MHANVRVHVETSAYGQGSYLVGVSCIIPDKPGDEPDLLEIEITFAQLDTQPTIRCADVVWGHPSGHLETAVYPHPSPLDDTGWARLLDALPRLEQALDAGLRRGHPPS